VGSDYWHPIWSRKDPGDVRASSGRSTYSQEETLALVKDARAGLNLEPWDTLLDVGCAAGLIGEHLAPTVQRYVGVDYNVRAVLAFNERCRVETVHASATELPFSDGEFSKSLLSSVLLCLSKSEGFKALKELRRVTTKRAFISGNLDHGGLLLCPNPEQYDQATWYWPGDLLDMCRDVGFTHAETRPMNGKIPQAGFQFDVVATV
jgi:SAM-dependent methyltransferase